MADLAPQESAVAWELRGAWAGQREVVLRLADLCVVPRVRGYVSYVAPSGAYALLEDGGAESFHVPCAYVLSVRRPHFHESADGALAPPPPPRRPEVPDGQLAFTVESTELPVTRSPRRDRNGD